MEKMRKIYGLLFLVTFLWFVPSTGLSQCNVSIDWPAPTGTLTYPSIQTAVNALPMPANFNTPINVSGTCNEFVSIPPWKDNVRLIGIADSNGIKPAIICTNSGTQPPGNTWCATRGTIIASSKQVLISGFDISGGTDGITVNQGGNVTVQNSIIHHNNRSGILLTGGAVAQIVNNEIRDNGITDPESLAFTIRAGILIGDNSTAYIGYSSPADAALSPNNIHHNQNGIWVSGSARGRIAGNMINENMDDGIVVAMVSNAILTLNEISQNGQNGIFVTQNSGVNLSVGSGKLDFDGPNTSTIGNGNKGLKCSIGGYADGSLGTLTGTGKRSATEFTKDCINNLIP